MNDEPNQKNKGGPVALSASQVEALIRGGSQANEIARVLESHSPSRDEEPRDPSAYRGQEKAKPAAESPEDALKLGQGEKTPSNAPRIEEMRGGRPELKPPDR